MKTEIEKLTAVDLINDKRRNLKKIIDLPCAFEAFQLSALHIEFLGKLLYRLNPIVTTSWENDTKADVYFNKVVTELPSMQKYNQNMLRDNLRNGMIHNEIPKANLCLTETASQVINALQSTINIHAFFNDFDTACNEVIARLKQYEKDHPGALENDKKFPHLHITKTIKERI